MKSIHPLHDSLLKIAIDSDGNVIREGMAATSDGQYWSIGYASKKLVRLDRTLSDGQKESRFIGKKRFACIHLLG
jgi:hypothetical protein